MRGTAWARSVPAILSAVLLVAAGCQISIDQDGVPLSEVVAADSTGRVDAGGTTPDTGAPDLDGGGATPDANDGSGGGDVADGGGDTAAPANLPDDLFADPVAVALTADYVFVANAALDAGWADTPGFITVITRAGGRVINRIPTTQAAPFALAVVGDDLVVVNRGPVTDGTPSGPGGVDLIDLAAVPDAAMFDRNVEIAPTALAGAPASLAVTIDGTRAFLGSATAGVLFEVNLATATLVRGADDPVVVTGADQATSLVVRTEGEHRLWIADRAAGLVHAYDPTTGELDSAATGAPFSLGEGAAPIDLAFHTAGSDIWVLALQEGLERVTAVDTANQTVVAGDTFDVVVGAEPRALSMWGALLYVLSAGEEAVQRNDLDAADADDRAHVLFRDGDDPTAFALEEDGAHAWVALRGSHTVARVDLMHGWATAVLGASALPGTCRPPATGATLPAERFAGPTAVLYAGGFVFVANTNPDAGGVPGQGFVTVVDPDSRAVVNRIATTQPNPRDLASDGRWLYVVNTGPLANGDTEAAGPGGVDVIDIAGVVTAAGPAANVEIAASTDDARLGAPGRILLREGGQAYLGGYLGPFLYEAALASCTLVRGADDPIVIDAAWTENDRVTPVAAADRVGVLREAADQAHLFDPATGDWSGAPFPLPLAVAGSPGGPVDAIFHDGAEPKVFVLLAASPWVAAVSLATSSAFLDWASAGTTPTRMAALDDTLFVVDAGRDAVISIAMATGAGIPTYVSCPDSGSPFGIAAVELPGDLRRAYVSNLVDGSLSVFDLTARSEIETIR